MSITGKYELRIQSPAGLMTAILDIVEADGKVTGTQTDDSGPHDVLVGKWDGEKMTYKVETKTPLGNTKMKGELHFDGDKVEGHTQFMLGKLAIEGNRI